jgi:hypothetical protein
MNMLKTASAVLLGSALAWSGCGGDSGPQADERREAAPQRTEGQLATPPAEKAPQQDEAAPKTKPRKAAAKSKPAEAPSDRGKSRKPTAEQISEARENQGDEQTTRRSPREERLFKIGSERQGDQQKQPPLSAEEQRAFKLGSESDRYQNQP